MSVTRSQFLRVCVARLSASHADFVQSRDDKIGPRHAFWMAAEALIKAFDDPTADVPGNCRKIFTSVMGDGETVGFKAAWRNWTRRELVNARPTWKPSASVYRAFADLKQAMKAEAAAPARMVKTVAQLATEGVDDNQIAKIYERYTRAGGPDLDWVYQMKQHPEQNTEASRRVGQRKAEMSRSEWQAFAEKLWSNPRIQQVLEMLERGEDPEGPRSVDSRFTEEFTMREYEQAPYEDLPKEWEQPNEEAAQTLPEVNASNFGEEAPPVEYEASSVNIDQRAAIMLDEGVADKDILDQLGISGQKLGAIKRRKADLLEGVREATEA